MVKTYLRYELYRKFGVIADQSSGTSWSNIEWDHQGKHVLAPALEKVHVWNMKQDKLLHSFDAKEDLVTCMARSKNGKDVAVGYSDGKIRIWNMETQVCQITLQGHQRAVTSIRYNSTGMLLVSGSNDTDIIVWDPVAERGLYRLRGHKDAVTDCLFLERGNRLMLASCSKDNLLKFWDLQSQHCVQTIVDHRSEVWSIDTDRQETILACGSSESQIRVYKLNHISSVDKKTAAVSGMNDEEENTEIAIYWDSLSRTVDKRAARLRFHKNLMAVQTAGKVIEWWRIRTEEEMTKKMKRRIRRKRKASELAEDEEDNNNNNTKNYENLDETITTPLTDLFEQLVPFRSNHKIVSFAFHPKKKIFIASLANNSIITVSYILKSGENPKHPDRQELATEQSYALTVPGHRSGVRSIVFSSDDKLIATASSDQVKIWNVESAGCIGTFETGYGLNVLFVPGNEYIILATKTGELELWQLSTGELISKVNAHPESSIWAIDHAPKQIGFVTGGSDKEVKFWKYELITKKTKTKETKELSFLLSRSLKLTDDCLCLKHTADGKYLAVGSLDATIKLFHEDTLTFYLSLYGHKLPVLCMDISDDSRLLVSGSADKNIKIWGVDFGDCHKSMFAHNESVMKVQFVPDTHYLFSAGKDNVIKYWDCDKFEHIFTLEAHSAPLWSLAISSDGLLLASGGNDRSICLWDQTDEPVFLEEEREKEMEKIFDDKSRNIENKENHGMGFVEGGVVSHIGDSASVAKAGNISDNTLMDNEKLINAIEVAIEEVRRIDEIVSANNGNIDKNNMNELKKAGFIPNQVMGGLLPAKYVFKFVERIRYAHMEELLMSLPFKYAIELIKYLDVFIVRGWKVEHCVQCVIFLLMIHQAQIIGNQVLIPTLDRIRINARANLSAFKDQIGYNMAALGFMEKTNSSQKNSYFFGDAPEKKSIQSRESFSTRKALGF